MLKKETRRTFIKNTAIVTGTAMATPSLTFSMFNKLPLGNSPTGGILQQF